MIGARVRVRPMPWIREDVGRVGIVVEECDPLPPSLSGEREPTRYWVADPNTGERFGNYAAYDLAVMPS